MYCEVAILLVGRYKIIEKLARRALKQRMHRYVYFLCVHAPDPIMNPVLQLLMANGC
jgi:hypothetical protein